MKTYVVTKEADDDPVILLQDDWCDAYAAIILGHVDASKFILDNRDKGAEEKELWDMTMYQRTSYHTWHVLSQ